LREHLKKLKTTLMMPWLIVTSYLFRSYEALASEIGYGSMTPLSGKGQSEKTLDLNSYLSREADASRPHPAAQDP